MLPCPLSSTGRLSAETSEGQRCLEISSWSVADGIRTDIYEMPGAGQFEPGVAFRTVLGPPLGFLGFCPLCPHPVVVEGSWALGKFRRLVRGW